MKNLFSCFAFLMAFVASSFTTPEASVTRPAAHFDAFLKIEGIDGESADRDHKGWIELESASFHTAARSVAIERTRTRSSSLLALACAQGKHFSKAVLHIRKSGGDGGTYLKYELKDVLITSYQTSAGAASPKETFQLEYAAIVRE